MKKFEQNELGWFCGFWNNSNLAIYKHKNKNELYKNETSKT
jgi:hypothetical protein